MPALNNVDTLQDLLDYGESAAHAPGNSHTVSATGNGIEHSLVM